MQLEWSILSPTERWPVDPLAIETAVRTQGPFDPRVAIDGDIVGVRDAGSGLTATARLESYPPRTYETLLAGSTYQARMTDRDRDTALPFQRVIVVRTGPEPEGDAATQAFFHVAVTDGLWWLMGGFLVDPYRHLIWGWRRWRPDMPLMSHADALLTPAGDTAPGEPR